VAGCNYVLHSSGQLFSHKRKHERRLWDNSVPCKQLKLASSSATSSKTAATFRSDSPSISSLPDDATQCKVRDGTKLQGACVVGSQVQPPAMVKLTAVSEQDGGRPVESISINVNASDPAASFAISRLKYEIADSLKQDAASTTASPQPEYDTKNVDSAVGRSPTDSKQVPTTRISPTRAHIPHTAVEQSHGSSKNVSDDLKLQKKLEKKEYVDLEDLAKMTRLKQTVDDNKTRSEWDESVQHATTCCSASVTPLTDSQGIATPTNSTSSSALSLMPLKSLTTTKALRSGIDKRERDESWQKYLRRSVVSTISP